MRRKKSGFIAKIIVIVCILLSIFVGGFFFLDKLIVPKYFGSYGIYNVGDLVGVVSSLYNAPRESDMVTNGYTETDLNSAISRLQAKGYKIQNNGEIFKDDLENFKGEGNVYLTDCEFAAVCDKLIQSGMLKNALPNLNYLNVMNISVLEFTVNPDEKSASDVVLTDKGETQTYSKAHIKFIVKIETTDIRDQIAKQMETPMYLLKIIIPDKLYFTLNYDIDLNDPEERYSNGKITINGKKEKQSETLINLLINFIFPAEDNMNIVGFTKAIGDVALEGIDRLGDFKFISGIGISGQNNGIFIN